MWAQLTYRQKNLLLLVGGVVLLYLAYALAIKETIKGYQMHTEYQASLEAAAMAPQEIASLSSKLQKLNRLLGHYELTDTNNHEHVLDYVSGFCQKKGLGLKHFPEPEIIDEKDFFIISNKIEVEGAYTRALQLINELERGQKLGRIASVVFEKRKDRKTRKLVLTTTIFLQRIKFKNG